MCQRSLCSVVTDELPAQELGEHRDRAVFLTGEASPSFNEPDDFVAVLYYNDPRTGDNTEVAVIDTTHESPHIHQNYLYGRKDEKPDKFDGSFWEALSYLEDNWKDFVHEYLKNSDDAFG